MIINWQSHIGKYLHSCDACGEEFHGRKNQQYCNLKCKAKHNNELAATKRVSKENLSGPYLKNIEILKDVYGDSEPDVIEVSMARLKAIGFSESAPSNRIKGENLLWYKYGPYAIRPIEEASTFEIFKI